MNVFRSMNSFKIIILIKLTKTILKINVRVTEEDGNDLTPTLQVHSDSPSDNVTIDQVHQ